MIFISISVLAHPTILRVNSQSIASLVRRMAAAALAEEALNKLGEQLNCSICLETYTDPKLLRCGHFFCLLCLEKLLVQDDRQRIIITCPSCRTVTRIPNRNVAGLQPAFHVSGLFCIQDYVKKINEALNSAGEDASDCSQHTQCHEMLYCKTCEKLICQQCFNQGGKHHSHDMKLLVDLRYCSELESIVNAYSIHNLSLFKSCCSLINMIEVITHDQDHNRSSTRKRQSLQNRVLPFNNDICIHHLSKTNCAILFLLLCLAFVVLCSIYLVIS